MEEGKPRFVSAVEVETSRSKKSLNDCMLEPRSMGLTSCAFHLFSILAQ